MRDILLSAKRITVCILKAAAMLGMVFNQVGCKKKPAEEDSPKPNQTVALELKDASTTANNFITITLEPDDTGYSLDDFHLKASVKDQKASVHATVGEKENNKLRYDVDVTQAGGKPLTELKSTTTRPDQDEEKFSAGKPRSFKLKVSPLAGVKKGDSLEVQVCVMHQQEPTFTVEKSITLTAAQDATGTPPAFGVSLKDSSTKKEHFCTVVIQPDGKGGILSDLKVRAVVENQRATAHGASDVQNNVPVIYDVDVSQGVPLSHLKSESKGKTPDAEKFGAGKACRFKLKLNMSPDTRPDEKIKCTVQVSRSGNDPCEQTAVLELTALKKAQNPKPQPDSKPKAQKKKNTILPLGDESEPVLDDTLNELSEEESPVLNVQPDLKREKPQPDAVPSLDFNVTVDKKRGNSKNRFVVVTLPQETTDLFISAKVTSGTGNLKGASSREKSKIEYGQDMNSLVNCSKLHVSGHKFRMCYESTNVNEEAQIQITLVRRQSGKVTAQGQKTVNITN